MALTPDDIIRVRIQSVTVGDFIVPETPGGVWRVGRVEREGNTRSALPSPSTNRPKIQPQHSENARAR
jgi:hypothetical protein